MGWRSSVATSCNFVSNVRNVKITWMHGLKSGPTNIPHLMCRMNACKLWLTIFSVECLPGTTVPWPITVPVWLYQELDGSLLMCSYRVCRVSSPSRTNAPSRPASHSYKNCHFQREPTTLRSSRWSSSFLSCRPQMLLVNARFLPWGASRATWGVPCTKTASII